MRNPHQVTALLAAARALGERERAKGAMMEMQHADPYRLGKPVAITNHAPGRYLTWVHAAYEVGYAGASKTLCGRRFYDPMREGDGWELVSCQRCCKAIAKMSGRKEQE